MAVELVLANPGLLSTAWADPAQLDPVPQPQNVEYLEAKQLIRQKKWSEAVVVLRSSLRKSPDQLEILSDLGRALAFSGRREEALSVLAQAIGRLKGSPRDAMIRRSRVISQMFFTNATSQQHQDGMNEMRLKRFRQAREKFEKALETEPDNVETLTRLGQCLVLDSDFDSAAERLRFAKRLNPWEPEIRLWLGRALHQRGEVKAAQEELVSAQRELAQSELAAIWLAEVWAASGQKALAIAVLEEHMKKNPGHLSALLTLARQKLLGVGRDPVALWSVRKDLQVALSRLQQDLPEDATTEENDLRFVVVRSKDDLRKEIERSLEQVDLRIADVSQLKAKESDNASKKKKSDR